MADDSLEVFDSESAIDRCGGDLSFFDEVFSILCEDCATNLSRLRTALQAGDFEDASDIAHSSKSALGNMGAVKAQRRAASLEALCRDKQRDLALSELAVFESEVEEYKRAVRSFRGSAQRL